MNDLFSQYVAGLFQNVPMSAYEGLLSIFCVGTVFILTFTGFRKGLKHIWRLLLVEYVLMLFCLTVFFREASEAISGHDFHPFWSYSAIQQGCYYLLAENFMNVVAFVPFGWLFGANMHGNKEKVIWRNGWLITFWVGLCISVSIETLQYFTHRGFSEFDDVFHNTFGTMIGYGLWIGIYSINMLLASMLKVKNNKINDE